MEEIGPKIGMANEEDSILKKNIKLLLSDLDDLAIIEPFI